MGQITTFFRSTSKYRPALNIPFLVHEPSLWLFLNLMPPPKVSGTYNWGVLMIFDK